MGITSVYHVSKLEQPIAIDGNWDKQQWQNIDAVEITNFMGEIPKFRPTVLAKMMYNDENLFVIFSVRDRFVRCITNDINGPVWEDSCVEFFFSPDPNLPERYFNLEINCGGTPLMHYNIIAGKEYGPIEIEDLNKVEIAHSLPQVIDPEITDYVDWTIEYRIPLSIISKYSNLARPSKGVEWRGNFYKIAENNSNPHYMTWAVVNNVTPDFHLPHFFGTLIFN